MYEITIIEIKEVEEKSSEFCVIETRPYSSDELLELPEETQQLMIDSGIKKDVYGYAPEKAVKKTIRTDVLKQTVDVLDTQRVVAAINGFYQ